MVFPRTLSIGPECRHRHVRKAFCPLYLTGFCPNGINCTLGGHPKYDQLPLNTMMDYNQDVVLVDKDAWNERERERNLDGKAEPEQSSHSHFEKRPLNQVTCFKVICFQ